MPLPAPGAIRLPFLTQRPREDGCGLFVLQMLTGKPFEQLVGMIDWGTKTIYQTGWSDLTGVLAGFGWRFDGPHGINTWDEVTGLAIVHVLDDHFMLYDADQAVFYDPWEFTGPSIDTVRHPLSYLRVTPPAGHTFSNNPFT